MVVIVDVFRQRVHTHAVIISAKIAQNKKDTIHTRMLSLLNWLRIKLFKEKKNQKSNCKQEMNTKHSFCWYPAVISINCSLPF